MHGEIKGRKYSLRSSSSSSLSSFMYHVVVMSTGIPLSAGHHTVGLWGGLARTPFDKAADKGGDHFLLHFHNFLQSFYDFLPNCFTTFFSRGFYYFMKPKCCEGIARDSAARLLPALCVMGLSAC